MRGFVCLVIVLALAGCQSMPKNQDLSAQQGALTLNPDHQLALLETFILAGDFSEESKIQYLLSLLAKSKATFIRNGHRYNGIIAKEWLRRKINNPRFQSNPIDTAEEFVSVVCVKSYKTGEPYQVILENKRHLYLQRVMRAELNFLENAILAKNMIALPPDAVPAIEKKKDEIPVPVIAPAIV